MIITEAQYVEDKDGNKVSIRVVINDETLFVPFDPNNTEYAEITKQVEEGTLTVKDAE